MGEILINNNGGNKNKDNKIGTVINKIGYIILRGRGRNGCPRSHKQELGIDSDPRSY